MGLTIENIVVQNGNNWESVNRDTTSESWSISERNPQKVIYNGKLIGKQGFNSLIVTVRYSNNTSLIMDNPTFSVNGAGEMHATAGDIAGWKITPDSLGADGLRLLKPDVK